MLRRRSSLLISSNINRIRRFHHLGGGAMAAASNFMSGQRDFQMLSLRRLSVYASTSSAVDINDGRLFNNVLRLKACSSENHRSVLRSTNDFKNDRSNGNGNGLRKAKVYGPCLPQLLCVSEDVVRVGSELKSLESRDVNVEGANNRGSSNGFAGQPLPEKIMVAVDVDEGIRFYFSFLCLLFMCLKCL